MTADFSDTLQKPRCPSCRADLAARPPGYANDAEKRERRRRPIDAKKVEVNKRPLIELLVDDGRVVVVEGLPSGLFESASDVLRHEFFGQYGRVVNLVMSDTAVAVRYASAAEATRARSSVDGALLAFVNEAADGAVEDDVVKLSARAGASRWCTSFLRSQPCTRRCCVDLHELRNSDMRPVDGRTASEHRLFTGITAQTAAPEPGKLALPHFPPAVDMMPNRAATGCWVAEPFELRPAP
eukprot:CAMPEP_0174882894 /NCGR_PEP_ID=MMETSP1114-20130205/84993_1 /TAXON_ID=312471 /ORGANISM="Neobodo designis, Strain CCAP 1951/1" /LENGTH=239 /DNA_ID=CAMNT_0016118295 /DNA_START=141 /DNA_END=856 /DNA_ORIENTATION=+